MAQTLVWVFPYFFLMYYITHCFSKLLFNLGRAGALLLGVASVWVRERGPLTSAPFLCCRARAQPSQLMHLVAPQHVDSSRIRDRTCASCTGGQVPNRQSTREGWVCPYDCTKTPQGTFWPAQWLVCVLLFTVSSNWTRKPQQGRHCCVLLCMLRAKHRVGSC